MGRAAAAGSFDARREAASLSWRLVKCAGRPMSCNLLASAKVARAAAPAHARNVRWAMGVVLGQADSGTAPNRSLVSRI